MNIDADHRPDWRDEFPSAVRKLGWDISDVLDAGPIGRLVRWLSRKIDPQGDEG